MATSRRWETNDGNPIGAWIFKCNPDVFDAIGHLQKHGVLTSWAVRQSYRCEMFAKDQPALLWITAGKGQNVEPGFYAFGEVVDSEIWSAHGEGEFWTDEGEESDQDLYVGVQLRPLAQPVLKSQLLALNIGFEESEPVRAAQLPNPMVLRPDVLEGIEQGFSLETREPTTDQLAALQVANSDEVDFDILLEIYDSDENVLVVAEFHEPSGSEFVAVDPRDDKDDSELPTYRDLRQLVGYFRFPLDELGMNAVVVADPLNEEEVLEQFIASLPKEGDQCLVRADDHEFAVLELPPEDSDDEIRICATGSTPTEALWMAWGLSNGNSMES